MSASPFSIRLDPELRARLEKMADIEDRSSSYIIQQALSDYLDSKEFFLAEMKKAEAALENGKFVSWDRVHAWMNSWDSDSEEAFPEPDSQPVNAALK